MTRTITALFDSRADAEMARSRLESAGIDTSDLEIADRTTRGYDADEYSTREKRGFWASLKGAFLPDDDRHVFEEGVRRGGHLLSGDVNEGDADEALRILDAVGTVDVDRRADDWTSAGWDRRATTANPNTSIATRDRGVDADETVIPVVEEQIRIGKREVDRGGVRVRSYVVETPVSEHVTLRDEHVSVERRPVDQSVSAMNGDAFRERTIEMIETAEEAIVTKDARIVEEIVVRKDATDRTETVSDTVRRTDVEVEDLARTSRPDTRDTAASDDRRGASLGDKIAGLAKEGAGEVTGNDFLERRGEIQQGKSRY